MDGNRIYQGVVGDQKYKNMDGDISASMYDWDNNAIVVRPDPFTVTDGCILRPNWNMAVCPHKYGKVCFLNPRRYIKFSLIKTVSVKAFWRQNRYRSNPLAK